MPAIKQDPLGTGAITWLGINKDRGTFSTPQSKVVIGPCGFVDDIYSTMDRKIAGHDVDYVETDGVEKGDPIVNLRQITIVEKGEIEWGASLAGIEIEPGMLRENMVVDYQPAGGKSTFSKVPPMSRMVIDTDEGPKVLILTEENGPCKTITRPIARHFGKDHDFAERLRTSHLKDKRGQMAMVRNLVSKTVVTGASFKIFPPMGY